MNYQSTDAYQFSQGWEKDHQGFDEELKPRRM